jgi:hypothetical protein
MNIYERLTRCEDLETERTANELVVIGTTDQIARYVRNQSALIVDPFMRKLITALIEADVPYTMSKEEWDEP